jgi:hypothetical protein
VLTRPVTTWTSRWAQFLEGRSGTREVLLVCVALGAVGEKASLSPQEVPRALVGLPESFTEADTHAQPHSGTNSGLSSYRDPIKTLRKHRFI